MAGPFSIRQTCEVETRDLVIEVMDGKYPCGRIIGVELYPDLDRALTAEDLYYLADTVLSYVASHAEGVAAYHSSFPVMIPHGTYTAYYHHDDGSWTKDDD